ncbi:MAG: cell division protein FtsA [Patescibacteria group bacterium]|nr:cell division protein FtsA [Patescibacteria group bacterium]
MPREKIITSLDIGSSSVKILVVKKNKKENNIEIVLKSEQKSDGIRRGTVINIDKISNVLKSLLSKASQDLNQQINSAYISLGGSHIFSTYSRGLVSVSRADRKISEEDINRVLQAAQATISLPSNNEIFEILPKEFIVDGQRGIKDPLGLEGVRLETEILALGGFSPYLKNTRQAILSSDLEALDMTSSSLAAARACLTDRQKELGVALVDIGAGITSLVIFEEGNLVHLAVLPMGSGNITTDIAIGLKTDIDIAERIKIQHGSCVFKGKDIKRKINILDEDPLIFSQRFLTNIITVRVSEIFEQVNEELKKISKEKMLPAGIVLAGGGAKLPNMIKLAKKKFSLPCSLGRPKGIIGFEKDLSWATACGLALLGFDIEEEQKLGFFKKIWLKLRKIFRIFIP